MPAGTVKPITEQERQEILNAYRQLLRLLHGKMKDDDQEQIRKAFELAAKAHEKQRRKAGDPYIMHPIEVARICIEEIGLGPTAAVCALLHDVVEDTDLSLEDIKEEFGEKVAKIVDGLTKLDNTSESESPQAENFRKVLSTLESRPAFWDAARYRKYNMWYVLPTRNARGVSPPPGAFRTGVG